MPMLALVSVSPPKPGYFQRGASTCEGSGGASGGTGLFTRLAVVAVSGIRLGNAEKIGARNALWGEEVRKLTKLAGSPFTSS